MLLSVTPHHHHHNLCHQFNLKSLIALHCRNLNTTLNLSTVSISNNGDDVVTVSSAAVTIKKVSSSSGVELVERIEEKSSSSVVLPSCDFQAHPDASLSI
uniref:Uncharacterized protein n=1 Tax=Tanacetum cinerariifolium TaxID=118510 RepID=A0A699IAB1_TANCI|nr:hypothetical protein [Tanacetum cinerariifolium]